MHRLVIENLPTDLYEQLNESAVTHHRPIEREAVMWLEQAFRLRRVDPDVFLARLESLNREIPLPPLTDAFLAQAEMEGRP